VVAAHTHFPTSYQRAKVIKFSNEGNAAITQNCPLGEGRSYLPSFFSAVTFNIPFLCQYATLLPQGGGRAKAREKRQNGGGHFVYFFCTKCLRRICRFFLAVRFWL